MDASIAAMKDHHKKLKETWGIVSDLEIAIPEQPFSSLREEILRHV